jgi:Ca-activated chloride channel family protein
MTVRISPLPDEAPARPDAGLGTLATADGNLPLDAVDVHAAITGLVARVVVTQEYRNPFDVPLEATYIFPLPDRAAVTGMRMEAADRVIEGVLEERGQARRDYDAAIAAGQRAAIAEEDRPDVFTMRVGNILPGERVTVRLTLDQPLPFEDQAATFRFPLVVAPRYIPGAPLGDDAPAGAGVAPDTDAVPDASRISPPVLLPGFPNLVRLSLAVDVDPAGLPLTEMHSALHVVATSDGDALTTVRLAAEERLDRDFILRLGFASHESSTLYATPDPDGEEGTYTLTILPEAAQPTTRPWDVVLVLDRSGSMGGWKIVAARRAAARIIDTLTSNDRFAVLCFDHTVEESPGLDPGLLPATDRNRFRAVEHLAGLTARGGTEMLTPLQQAAALLVDPERDRVLVLITDGQIGNEDQILRVLSPALSGVRVHTVGIDRAVNAGFLHRLAAAGQGRAELVESEERLDEAMEHIHRRIMAPLVTDLSISVQNFDEPPRWTTPADLSSIYPGVPLVVSGRYRGRPQKGTITVHGRRPDGSPWRHSPEWAEASNPAATTIWARAHLRQLEDQYVVNSDPGLEQRIVDTSLRFGVLCRFTAFVAVDTRTATSGEPPHQVIQPVEQPAGWERRPGRAAMPLAMTEAVSSAAPVPTDAALAGGLSLDFTGAPSAAEFGRDSGGRPESPRPAEPLDLVRRRLSNELRFLRAMEQVSEPERRWHLTTCRALLDSLLTDLRVAGIDAARFTELSDLLTALTAWVASGDPATVVWDRTIRTLAAFTERRPFWKQRP